MTGVLVAGAIARDLVLRVDELPDDGGAAEVLTRIEVPGGKGTNQAVGLRQLGADRVSCWRQPAPVGSVRTCSLLPPTTASRSAP